MQTREFAPAVAMLLATLAITVQARFSAPDTGRIGVFFPPWIAADDAFLRVTADDGVAIVDGGKFDNIIIAEMSDPASKARIYAAGAWFMFDPRDFGGCFSL